MIDCKIVTVVCALGALTLPTSVYCQDRVADAEPILMSAVRALCDAGTINLSRISSFGTAMEAEGPSQQSGAARTVRKVVRLKNGGVMRILQYEAGARYIFEYFEPTQTIATRARISAGVSDRCNIVAARKITYDFNGRPQSIEHLDGLLKETGKRDLVNPPIPAGADPGGVSIAIVDSGVNYLLPDVLKLLARDSAGRLEGYDYSDLDDRPFDGDPLIGSPFAPFRHGTSVASVFMTARQPIRLLPYRFSGANPDRWQNLIDDIARRGAKIVNISVVGYGVGFWDPFEKAVRRHPEILFVVAAGNDGVNSGAVNVYPAKYGLENVITVGSALVDKTLSPRSNWGEAIDVAVEVDPIEVISYEGRLIKARGTSYAAPLVAIFAAQIISDQPNLSGAKLKKAITGSAIPCKSAARCTKFGILPNNNNAVRR